MIGGIAQIKQTCFRFLTGTRDTILPRFSGRSNGASPYSKSRTSERWGTAEKRSTAHFSNVSIGSEVKMRKRIFENQRYTSSDNCKGHSVRGIVF